MSDLPLASGSALIAEAFRLSTCLLSSSRDRSNASHLDRQRARLKDIQSQLQQNYLHQIQRDRLAAEDIPLPVRQAFVRAALLVTRYRQVSGEGWQSTLSSFTLKLYEADPIPAELAAPESIASLCHAFQLSESDREQYEELLQNLDVRIDGQKRIIRAVLNDMSLMQLSADDKPIRDGVARLFQYLFDLAIPPECLHLVRTPLQLYFSLPLETPEVFDSMPESDRRQLQIFLDQMSTFDFDSFRRFPTFGPCRPENIDDCWAAQIAHQSETTSTRVKQVLSESVGVLPRARAEAFLIHDIWGHYWQALLSSLQGDYAVLATCDEPLRSAETAYTPYGPLQCGKLFEREGDRVNLDEDRARIFFHGEVRQRLGLLFSHMLGEMIADIAEYKFVRDRPDESDRLLSSSLFKHYPVKLDLALGDLDFLYLRVLKPLLEIHLSPMQHSPLEMDLLAHWKTLESQASSRTLEAHLQTAISRLNEIFLEEYRSFYLADIERETSLFHQTAVNLIYMHNVMNRLLMDSPGSDRLPYLNLAIVFASSFSSEDGFSSFWWLDDVLASYFLPCRELLKEWLEINASHS